MKTLLDLRDTFWNRENLEWMKAISFDGFSRKPLIIALASISGFALTGATGYSYIKWREQIDEQVNEYVQLDKVAEDVWSASYSFQMKFPPFGVRSNMFVIRLKAGLMIYNPVKLTPQIKKQIGVLGAEVKFIFIANREHLLFFTEYVETFPNVKVLCPPGTLEVVLQRLKKKKISPTNGIVEIKDEVSPEGVWEESELEHHFFQGFPWLSEVVLFHKPSQLLIMCDLGLNIKDGLLKMKDPKVEPIFHKLVRIFGAFNNLAVSPSFKFLIKDKVKCKESLAKICQWNFKGIAMAHGFVIPPTEQEDIKQQWKSSWEKLLG